MHEPETEQPLGNFSSLVLNRSMWRFKAWWRYLVIGAGYFVSQQVDGMESSIMTGLALGVLGVATTLGVAARVLPSLRETTLKLAQEPSSETTPLRLDHLFSCSVTFIVTASHFIAAHLH